MLIMMISSVDKVLCSRIINRIDQDRRDRMQRKAQKRKIVIRILLVKLLL